MKIAFLGLGIMGRPMASNLVKAGNELTVWNRTPGKTVAGARLAATPAEAAKGAGVVWLCVSDAKAVEAILFGPEGIDSVLRAGMTVVDSSTIAPADSRRFAQRITAKGAAFVDAPVTGGKTGSETAQLVFIVGGPAATVESLQPLFGAMGKKVIYFGETGMGQAAKLGMNLMAALYYEAFAEAFTLIRKLGVGAGKWMELIRASGVHSALVDTKARMALAGEFPPNFPLRLMHKDIRLMLQAARESGAKLPVLERLEQEIYQQAGAEQQNLDFAATVLVLEKLAGTKSA